MLKFIFLVLASIFMICGVKAQHRDSTIFYYQYDQNGSHEVGDLKSADYFRVVLSPDSVDNNYILKEFYKNGNSKLIGKFDPQSNPSIQANLINFIGEVVSFYPNGKKQSVVNYTHGRKDGNEYLFYPNGLLYCYIKNHIENDYLVKSLYWECYDSNGTIICQKGNGKWVTYDKEFKIILVKGKIKNGLKEGEWHGRTGEADSIKYLYIYHEDDIISATGYDKSGKSYPFKEVGEAANYKGGPITFIKIFKSHLTLPKDLNERKISLDTVQISFIVEKDGLVTDFKTSGNVNPEIANAFKNAMDKCHDWLPSLYYGIPLRTRIFLPLTFIHGYSGNSRFSPYTEEVSFQEQVLGF